jgi:hypothetical protein
MTRIFSWSITGSSAWRNASRGTPSSSAESIRRLALDQAERRQAKVFVDGEPCAGDEVQHELEQRGLRCAVGHVVSSQGMPKALRWTILGGALNACEGVAAGSPRP